MCQLEGVPGGVPAGCLPDVCRLGASSAGCRPEVCQPAVCRLGHAGRRQAERCPPSVYQLEANQREACLAY